MLWIDTNVCVCFQFYNNKPSLAQVRGSLEVDEQLQNSLNDGSTCIIRQSLQPVISRIQALLMYGFQCIRFTKQSV